MFAIDTPNFTIDAQWMKKNKRSWINSSINSKQEREMKQISLDFTHQNIKEYMACIEESKNSHGHFEILKFWWENLTVLKLYC